MALSIERHSSSAGALAPYIEPQNAATDSDGFEADQTSAN